MPRFLIVDDEPINLIVIKTILTAEGHDVLAVHSGVEAVEVYRGGDTAFDMILLDVHMPELNGFETAGELRNLGALKDAPIIFVSARATQADQAAGLAAGGQYYLTKPFRRKDLLEAIGRFLPHHAGAAAPREEIA